jgi:hypothetical protein
MDVVAAQPAVKAAPETAAAEDKKPAPPAPLAEKKPAAPVTPPRKPATKSGGNGAGMAIIATVIIVLGLGLMATYAYLQTKK